MYPWELENTTFTFEQDLLVNESMGKWFHTNSQGKCLGVVWSQLLIAVNDHSLSTSIQRGNKTLKPCYDFL
jgi:hypothetical protein